MRSAGSPPPREAPPALTSRERTGIARSGPGPERPQEPPSPRRSECLRCGGAFVGGMPVHAARRYCGVPCRRAAEYEVRRVGRLLAACEAEHSRRVELDRVNNGLLRALRSFDGRSWQDDLNDLQSEVAALRRRLRELRHPVPPCAAERSLSHEPRR